MIKESIGILGTAKTKATLYAAGQHALRLEEAILNLSHISPFSEQNLQNCSYQEWSNLDMLAARFTKLYNLISHKIIRIMVLSKDGDITSKKTSELLDRSEQLGLISSQKEWLLLKNIRDNLDVDFFVDPSFAVRNFNALLDRSSFLLSVWYNLKKIMGETA